MTIYQNHDPNIYAAFELAPGGAEVVPVAAWRIGCDALVPMVVTNRGLSALSDRFPSDRQHASEYYGGSATAFRGIFGLDRRADKDFLLYLAGDHVMTGTLEVVHGYMTDPLITVREAEEAAQRYDESLCEEVFHG